MYINEEGDWGTGIRSCACSEGDIGVGCEDTAGDVGAVGGSGDEEKEREKQGQTVVVIKIGRGRVVCIRVLELGVVGHLANKRLGGGKA